MNFALPITGLFIGVGIGLILYLTRFCTMGAVADIALSNNYDRMRSWVLAMITAIIGTQLLQTTGLVDINTSQYLDNHWHWLGAIIGGLCFGFGMVIACGCGGRSLVMAAAGDMRALFAVIVLAIVAYITMRGIFSIPRQYFYEYSSLPTESWLESSSISGVLNILFKHSIWSSLAATVLVISPMLYFVLKEPGFLSQRRRIFAGISIGLIIVLCWAATGWIFHDEFDIETLQAVSFVEPVGDSLQYLMLWTGSKIDFGIAIVYGVIAGAFAASIYRGEFVWRGFEDAVEMGRYMLGATLMGFGGVLAGGCTFGQGLSGISTLSLTSILATASIIWGGLIGIKYLEEDSFSRAIKFTLSREDG